MSRSYDIEGYTALSDDGSAIIAPHKTIRKCLFHK